MKKLSFDEEAVSPVIGVILMVAIVVILAAVIAAFVFGMAGNVQTTKTVGVTVAQINNSSMMQTFQGGKDAALVMDLTSKITPSDGTATIVEMWDTPLMVGDTKIVVGPNPGSFSGRDHVVVVANFTDGSTQVVLDTYT